MGRTFWIITIILAAGLLYVQCVQSETEGQNPLEAYNQTNLYNWSAQYPEYELEYLLNETENASDNLTYKKDREEIEREKWYEEHQKNITTYNLPGSEVNPLKYSWYYRSNYTHRYNPFSGNFTDEPQGANLTYNPYTQKWEYRE